MHLAARHTYILQDTFHLLPGMYFKILFSTFWKKTHYSEYWLMPLLKLTFAQYLLKVMRVIRMIKASPMLEDFCWKIFGPGRKLGSLILFTMCLLLITSCVSLQLFCSIKNFHKFETFPQVSTTVLLSYFQELESIDIILTYAITSMELYIYY